VQTDTVSKTLWSFRSQSIVKTGNDQYQVNGQQVSRANEDRLRVDPALIAVADGAGSSGLFCGPWAETLVKGLPAEPIASLEALDQWLGGLSDGFYRDHEKKLDDQPAKRSKFVREGSYATLAACWFGQDGDDAQAQWLCYGDSMVMIFDRSGDDGPVLMHVSPGDLGALARAPHLLNWKNVPVQTGLECGRMILPAHASVMLASDAVGQYVLLRYLACGGRDGVLNRQFRSLAETGQGKLAELAQAHVADGPVSFDEEWDIIARALTTEAHFAAWVKHSHDLGLMANDDATLIMLDSDAAPEPTEDDSEEEM